VNPLHNTLGDGRPLTPTEIDDALTIVRDTFRGFRTRILERAGHSAYSDKRDGSPVTDTDVEIEAALQAALAKRFPGMVVLGEETGYDDAHLPNVCWLIDPIDGTQSFIANLPFFTSMAVLIQDKEAVACIIYNPSADTMYSARKAGGAYRDDTRLDIRQLPMADTALCKPELIAPLNALLRSTGVRCETPPVGSGHGFTRVADGLAAARFQLHGRGSIHDYAPGALLIQEAGGIIIPVKDTAYTYETRSFVACHPALAARIREQLPAIRALEW